VEAIAQLGFTRLEAEIYVYLLQHSPATGYKIANGIGRSFPNTYKALSSLRAKGAILVDEGSSRLSRAIPVDELLDQMQTRFTEQRASALEAVERLPKSTGDSRIYQLNSADQVYERGRRMLRDARERVLMELFPEPLETLRSPIEAAAARGVEIAARIYEPAALEGVRLVHSPYGEENLRTLGSQWLALFVDGAQFLLAHLFKDGKGVYQATWSANPFLARAFYDYINSDLHHYAFQPHLKTARSLGELREGYDRLQAAFPVAGDLGWKSLLDLFATDWSENSRAAKGNDDHDK
jgi:sugar-specific transcriptional regulator TrmB